MDRYVRVLGRARSGPSNDPAVVGRMHPLVGRHLVESIGTALEQAGTRHEVVEGVSLNLSGDPPELGLAAIELNDLSQAQCAALLAVKQAGLQLGPEIYAAARSDGTR